jgi:DNA-binding NarL/FixJ family response regulator
MVEVLERDNKFELFILDLELPDTDGFEAIATIRRCCPGAALLIFTMHEEPWVLAKLARLDIQGVVAKSSPVSELLQAVTAIRAGQTYYNDSFVDFLEKLQERPASGLISGDGFQLSERELEVLRCITRGLNTSQISEELFLSQNTVGTYRTRLMRKLDAHNVAQLIAKGRKYVE